MATGLQNLKEDYLYEKLPEGIITLDEQNILRALIGGVQDRIEDIRSYAKKYEVLFSSEGAVNTVVLVTFDTSYGKVVVRSLDIQEDTPEIEGDTLTAWAADQLGLDLSQITSCVFGEDLLRFVDTNTLQYLAATIGAVLYQTAAQAGSEALNQQRILNSYFPRLKIKGTAMSFDILGKLIGFDDVRMTPLWGRLSPREPNDFGAAINDQDFAETPTYYPQQITGVAYDPHVFRDGPYYTWAGTVSADPESTGFYTQTVNGFQPWVKINVTGSVVHPAIGDSIILSGGSPHTKAIASAGTGLQFQALGEGEDFNGLEVNFQNWNNGTDRLVTITDRLSTIKYRTSYFDLALTLTDDHAIRQFGTTTTKPNDDLQDNPSLAEGRTAISPYRPWRGGVGDSHSTFHDYSWVSSGTVTPVTRRSQATSSISVTQFKTADIQAAGQEAVHIMDEVRAATRFPRRSSVGFLNRDDVNYAAQIEVSRLFDMSGTSFAEGIAESHPAPGYTMSAHVRNSTALAITFPTEAGYTYWVEFSEVPFPPFYRISDYFEITVNGFETFYAVIGVAAGFFVIRRKPTVAGTPTTGAPVSGLAVVSLSIELKNEFDPTSNGTIIRFSDGVFFNGTYDLDQHWYRFGAVANHHSVVTAGLQVDAYWAPTTTEVVRSDPSSVPTTQVFAAFGDNTENNNTYMVGTLVASWSPEFLLMLGDHNYTADKDKYETENRPFLPWIDDGKALVIPGNHDLDIQNGAAFYTFFKQDSRYYERRIGNVHVFAIDDGINTAGASIYPGGTGQLCPSAVWLKEALSASQAPWKVVMIHHNPYISANSGHSSYTKVRWPFKDWGADVVLFGHVHAYEHLLVADAERGNNGIHMLCLGLGGKSPVQFTGGGSFGSVLRYPQSPVIAKPGAARFTVTATTFKWEFYTTDAVLRETITLSKAAPSKVYQDRPEDEVGAEVVYDVFDEVPWRRDLIGNGELVELINRTPVVVDDVSLVNVSSKIAVKDHTGVDYTVHGLNSTVDPIRLAAEVNLTDRTYAPGQLAIAYTGEFTELLAVPPKRTDITPGFFNEIDSYGTNGFKMYHAGLVQGVLVADPVSFFGPHHRDGLNLWLPMNEHPDEGAVGYDRSVSGVVPEFSGFELSGSFANRVWDDSVGWNLYLKGADARHFANNIRQVGPDFAMSMWIKPDAVGSYQASQIYWQDPLFVVLDGSSNTATIIFVYKDNTLEELGTVVIGSGTFSQLAISVSGDKVKYGVANRDTALVMNTGTLLPNYQPFTGTHNELIMWCPQRGVSYSDLRTWNQSKTQDELEKVRDYQPVNTVCTYWPTNIEVAGSGDYYGLRVLDNGFISPDKMPPSVRLNQLARVTRYDSEGRFGGENRFNEVGLGGGSPLPPTWLLGQQFYEMTSTGTVAFCTSLGGANYNAIYDLLGAGAFLQVLMSGSTTDGITASIVSAAATPWPPAMDFNNPAHEFIWIKGDDNKVYEVSLLSTTTAVTMVGSLVVRERSDADLILNGALKVVTAGPTTPHGSWSVTGTAWVTFNNGTFNPSQVLIETEGTYTAAYSYASNGVSVLTAGTGEVKVYHPQSFRFADQPTGAQTILVTSGTELSCNYGGFVYQRYTGDAVHSTPPVYMYLTSRTIEDTSTPATTANSAWGRWTDSSDTSLYGNTLTPHRPALDRNGVLEFENTGDLVPGHYRLTIESGCIGRVDSDFDGFSVVLDIDTVQLEERLLVGQKGADFTGTDVFEFDYEGSNTANWLLTLQYLNAVSDVDRGTQRNLVIFNYKLERIVTDLYQVSIGAGPAPTLTQVQTGSYTGTNPGGWLAILNSYGTVVSVVHESNIFPANDTVTSVVPLSSMLTSNTWQRREDHFVISAGQSVLPDDGTVAMPTFGGIIVR